MFTRVLIANRGEIAVRIARTCRALGIPTAAVFSEADRHAVHVAAADTAVPIGPAPAAESYLSVGRIIDAARASAADAVHPGYGFLSEDPALPRACADAGLTFIGPPADVIARFGSKINARRAAVDAGVAVVPGGEPDASVPTEVVFGRLPAADWHERMDTSRFASLVVGPGLGRDPQTASAVRALVTRATVPLVLDGDALAALGGDAATALAAARAPVVLTPHDGEYELLAGQRPGADRLAAARALAATGATVLLKGSTTVVAAPDGAARFVTSGDARLATAGTGDVLAGMIGALLAQGLTALDAAALAAQVHGMAGALGPPVGLIAGDLLGAIPAVLAGALDPAPQGFGGGAGSR